MTKKQKIYGAILVLCAAAWLTDRLLLGGGVSAPQPVAASSLVAAPVAVPPSVTSTTKVDRSLSLFEKLDRLESTAVTESRDAFRPPTAWLPKTSAPVPLPVQATRMPSPPLVDSAAEAFGRSHVLTSVVRAGPDSYVLVGTRIVLQGQSIDGFRLISVGDATAVFEAEGQVVTLRLEGRREATK